MLRHRQHLHTYVLGSVRAHTVRYQAWGGLVIITMVNLVCHMLYSIPAAFFPLEASVHGMSSDGVGAHFALFAVVIIFLAPWAVVHMKANGAIATYRLGLLLISCATIAFSPAILFSKWWEPLFAWWSNAMRILQGAGAAMEEASAYVVIVHLAPPEHVSLFAGLVEVSTGLGYMAGTPLGGLLYALGGFAAPFIFLGSLLLMVTPLLRCLPVRNTDAGDEEQDETFLEQAAKNGEANGQGSSLGSGNRALLARHPELIVLAVVCVLANSDYAFLEPTLGTYAIEVGAIAVSAAAAADAADGRDDDGSGTEAAQIGVLYLAASLAYTAACPVAGWLAGRTGRPLAMISVGLAFQACGLVLLGTLPPIFGLRSLGRMRLALSTLGVGEAMSMTPMLEVMVFVCARADSTCSTSESHTTAEGKSGDVGGSAEGQDDADGASGAPGAPIQTLRIQEGHAEAVGGLLSCAFALGQVIGPVMGASLSSRLGMPAACGIHAALLACCSVAVCGLPIWQARRRRWRNLRSSAPHTANDLELQPVPVLYN